MNNEEAQFIRDENGKILYALVAYENYKIMAGAQARLEQTESLVQALSDESNLPELVDADIVHRIAEGENPVRVWREHRKLKAIELAKSAGISAAYLSEIETGKKDGTFKTMTAIASTLNIRLDDLAPALNASDQKSHNRELRLKAIKTLIQGLGRLIHEASSFDTAAVRSMALKLRAHIEHLDMEEIEADWLLRAHETAEKSLQLIDEAEKNIIHTASSTREQLLAAFQDYSPKVPSKQTSSQSSVEKIFSKKRSSSAA